MQKYTAIIIEPRKHKALSFVLKNFLENLSEEWDFIVFHGSSNKAFVREIVKTDLALYKNRITLVNLKKENLMNKEYNLLLKTADFYKYILTESFLIFQTDSLIIKENKHLINEFLKYDYVGAPWIRDRKVGNGGLSLRKKSKMLEIISKVDPSTIKYHNEDEYFCYQTEVPLYTPTFEEAQQFSVETIFNPAPFGIHNCFTHLADYEWTYLSNKYPDLIRLKELNTICPNPYVAVFTIVYKTYTNDIQWLEYSLLSLKKYLDFSNVYELIIYTHDVARFEVYDMLERLQLKHIVNVRVIPVHYNYHGYIKQQTVKANCYKDCNTDYIIILDSDLILKEPLDCEKLIQEDGKIPWKYLKIEESEDKTVFNVWKKACEDSTFTPKNVHYMSNGFPFVFTRKSLEGAANKFKELHNCDYDEYCKIRCDVENIRVEHVVKDTFFKLSRVFTEFEYLGYYCHHFSNDYMFSTTPVCKMALQSNPNNPDSYFIQNWSHGGIDETKKNEINNIIRAKTVILTWTTKYKNVTVDQYNNYFGLGDILRGTISMFQLSKKYNFHLIVDMQLHPLSAYFKPIPHEYSQFVLDNKDNIPFIYPEDIDEFLKKNTSNCCCLFTNSHLNNNELSKECKSFMKTLLTPTDEFNSFIYYVNRAKSTPLNYNIFHFRLGDSFLIRKEEEEQNNNFQLYMSILDKYKEETDILMSDSERFKEKIMTSNYPISTFHINIAHLGYEQHASNFKDTLFEFFTVTKAKKIKTFSFYNHISGFVNMAHYIYDIPIECVGLNNQEIKK